MTLGLRRQADGRPGLQPRAARLRLGERLDLDHGYPARLIIPGLYGYVSATKWLKEIEAQWGPAPGKQQSDGRSIHASRRCGVVGS